MQVYDRLPLNIQVPLLTHGSELHGLVDVEQITPVKPGGQRQT
jgi:hypothetical protein